MLGAFHFFNVDIVRNYWNHLEQWVFEKYDLLQGLEKEGLGVVK